MYTIDLDPKFQGMCKELEIGKHQSKNPPEDFSSIERAKLLTNVRY
jgi:hypothetical protein